MAGHHPVWRAGVPRDRGASWDFEDIRDFYAHNVFGEDLLAVRRVDPERYLQLGRLAVAEAMRECFAFWRRSDSGCRGALVLAGKDMCRGAGWGLLDIDGSPKAALDVLRRVWAPIAVIIGDDGLSGIRVDVYNDSPCALKGGLALIATGSAGPRVVDAHREIALAPHSSMTFHDSELSGAFRDLSHAFRFGPATADAVEATVRFHDSRTIRDALVIHPRSGQVNTGLRAVASRRDDDSWSLRISSDVALRYLTVDVVEWTPTDNYFHIAAGVPYTIELLRAGSSATPTGAVGSIDMVAATSITMAS